MAHTQGPGAQAYELEELTQIYVGRGLDYDLARKVAEQLTAKDVIRVRPCGPCVLAGLASDGILVVVVVVVVWVWVWVWV